MPSLPVRRRRLDDGSCLRPDCPQHRAQHGRIRSDDITRLQIAVTTVGLGDNPSRFLHEQRAGRNVPRIETELPETVEAPGRDVGEVQCRRIGCGPASATGAQG